MFKTLFTGIMAIALLILTIIVSIAIAVSVIPNIKKAPKRLCVKENKAYMRVAPGWDKRVLWSVERYYPVVVIEKKGNWYKVTDYENDAGWLHASVLEKTESVITTKNKCRLRSQPTLKSSVVFMPNDGVPFKVCERKGNWIKVQHNKGKSGWISQSLVW